MTSSRAYVLSVLVTDEMKQRRILGLGLPLLMSLSLGSAEAQKSHDDYQKALRAERTEGDLEKAVSLYKKVAEEATDKSLAAKAQLRIGMCYEKMGLKEAQEAYRKVIQDYPDQQQEVDLARERLAALTETEIQISAAPRFRSIRIPGNLQALSGPQLLLDGQQLAFAFQGALWLLPVQGKVHPSIAGKPRQLTEAVGADGFGMSWSANGEWLAFTVQGEIIQLARAEDGALAEERWPRHLSGAPGEYRMSLSPDGSSLAFSSVAKRQSCIYVVGAGRGEPRRVTESWTCEPAFSPDGRKIAYVKISDPSSEGKSAEVWVTSPTGGRPVQASEVGGKVRSPIWSPDGGMIAFLRASEINEVATEIWFVPVSVSGEPLAAARKIDLPLAAYYFLAGWTLENRIGIPVVTPYEEAIYTVPAAGGRAVQLTRSAGARHPRWSPDGERIYFRWDRGQTAFIPAEGGEVSVIEPTTALRIVEVTCGGGNAVSPDGGTIAFSAYQEGPALEGLPPQLEHIWIMPVEGGTPTELTRGPHSDRFPCWSPDGERIAFIRTGGAENSGPSIWMVSTDGGDAEPFPLESEYVRWSPISWSPDGELIAYFSRDDSLDVVSVRTHQSRQLAQPVAAGGQTELAWSPDSRELVYTSKGSIWRVSLTDGVALEVETAFGGEASNLDWSPDGETLAFTASTGGETVLVLMEDFLPLLENSSSHSL